MMIAHEEPAVRSPLRYPGGKARIATWIIDHLPPHEIYVEPFFGGGSVFFAKPPARVEVINDIDNRVVNLFRMIRDRPDDLARAVELTPWSLTEYRESDDVTDDPLESARRFLVRVWMAHGGKLASRTGWRNGMAGGTDTRRGGPSRVWCGIPDRIIEVASRLHNVSIDCRPAVDMLKAGWMHPDALVYADPPYVRETRYSANGNRGAMYTHEMDDLDHVELLAVLRSHPGSVVLSGYRCQLYDDTLSDWRRIDCANRASGNVDRVESLWLNPRASTTGRQQPLF